MTRPQNLGLSVSTPDTVFYHRIPVDLYSKIVGFINEKNYTSRTKAINDLLTIALIVVTNIKKIQDPEMVSEIRAQLHEGGLVKYVQSLNPHQLEVVWSIVDTEMKDRSQMWQQKIHGGKK